MAMTNVTVTRAKQTAARTLGAWGSTPTFGPFQIENDPGIWFQLPSGYQSGRANCFDLVSGLERKIEFATEIFPVKLEVKATFA